MLTLQYVPYSEIAPLASQQRIDTLLNIVREESIVVMEGQLTKSEETQLIRQTMVEIDETFKGIEIATIDPFSSGEGFINKMRQEFLNIVMGQRRGMTIIGPATVVKKIKQDPKKIYLFTTARKRKAKKKAHKRKARKKA